MYYSPPQITWASDPDGHLIINDIAALEPNRDGLAQRPPPERKSFSGLLSPEILEEERKLRTPCATFRAWDVCSGRNETLHVEAHFLRCDGRLCQIVGTARPAEPPHLPEAARGVLTELCQLICKRCGGPP